MDLEDFLLADMQPCRFSGTPMVQDMKEEMEIKQEHRVFFSFISPGVCVRMQCQENFPLC